jgi:hypothetical protein
MHLMRGCVAALFGQRCGVCSQAVLRGVGSLRLAAAPLALAGWLAGWLELCVGLCGSGSRCRFDDDRPGWEGGGS